MKSINRRTFAGISVGLLTASTTGVLAQEIQQQETQQESNSDSETPMPRESELTRDYAAPKFKPSWKQPQINRQLVSDFVIYAHSDLEMVKKLLEREPGLINSTMDWGNGDWETGLGGASHMGRKDIVKFLLAQGHRVDIFCAAMMGMLEVVKAMIELEPALIDTRGPHGFNLHFHAQVGQEDAKPVLEYLQSVKELELRPVPFLKKKKDEQDK